MMFGTNTWHTKQIIDNVSKDEVYLYSVKFLANLGVGSYAVHCSLVENDTHMHKNFEWRDGTLIFDVVNVDKEYFVGCMWNHMNFEIKKLQSS
jgi:lipopolysaccharide transport system ATP-binding protein